MEKNLLRDFKGYKIYEQQIDEADVNKRKLEVEGTAIAFEFDIVDTTSLNKAIEAAKTQINTLIKQKKNLEAQKPVQKCRVCGCTQDNCEQCIKKTGQPCSWVEEDLCSACAPAKVEEPEIKVVDTRASQQSGENIPQQQETNIPAPAGDSLFLQHLATLGNVDFSMRIMKVNGSFTIGITPGNAVKGMKPVNITGSPEEFDNEFITVIMPRLKEIKGLVHNIDDVKKEVSDKPATAAPKKKWKSPAKKKPSKPAVKKPAPVKKEEKKAAPKKPEKKPTVKKEKPVKEVKAPPVVETSLFDQPAAVIEESNS